MNYKFGEYIKKKESDFLNTKVNGSDLIRISDANNYYNSYNKQFSLSGVGNSYDGLLTITNVSVQILPRKSWQIFKKGWHRHVDSFGRKWWIQYAYKKA